MSSTGNSPELDELLRDGMENLAGLSDTRLREYAVFSLKEEGATAASTMAELVVMAGVQVARALEGLEQDVAVEIGRVGLRQMFVDLAVDLERELQARAMPN